MQGWEATMEPLWSHTTEPATEQPLLKGEHKKFLKNC